MTQRNPYRGCEGTMYVRTFFEAAGYRGYNGILDWLKNLNVNSIVASVTTSVMLFLICNELCIGLVLLSCSGH